MNIEMFSQMYQSLFAYAKRILVVCAVMMSATVVHANFSWAGKAELTVYGQVGRGKVYIAESTSDASISTPNNDANWTDGSMNAGSDKNVNSDNKSAYFAIHAKADTRYYFEGWYSDEARTESRNIILADYKATVTASSGDGKHDHYYANFARIISGIKTDKIFVWNEGSSIQSSRAKVVVPVHAAQDGDIMTIDIIDSDEYLPASDIKLYNADNIDITESKQITRAADGTFVFYVGYQGTTTDDISVLIQKKIKLHVIAKGNPDNRDWEDVELTIEEPSTLTFKGTNGKGRYSSNRLSSSFETNSNDSEVISITDMALLKGITLSLTEDPTDGEIFYGWQMIKANGTISFISFSESCVVPDLEGGETLEAIFIPNECAFVVMSGSSGKMTLSYEMVYSDLHQALIKADELYAVNNKNQFVVFDNIATLFAKVNITRSESFEQPYSGKDGTLLYRNGGYTIPKGVSLLIPGGADYKYVTSATIDAQLAAKGEGVTPASYTPKGYYRKLKVADGTTLKVEYGANISLYATIYGITQFYAGMPDSYGMIELGTNSKIILGDPNNDTSNTSGKAGLYALGYVTNAEETTSEYKETYGKVIAYSGSLVHEVFQYSDWRGGSIGMELSNDDQKRVFPILLYFIQNVEAPIVYHKGAKSSVSAMAIVSDMCLSTDITYIASIGTDDGFFLIGDDINLIKYYNRRDDRQRYIIKGLSTNPSEVSFGDVKLEMTFLGISGVNISSSQYPLPLTPNIDIELHNAKMNSQYDLVLLPGVSIFVADDSEINILENGAKPASVYVYDKDQALYNGLSYWGSNYGTKLMPIYHTPYGSQSADNATRYNPVAYKRMYDNLTDATIDVNGKIVVGSGYNSKSGLYTTEGKAQIYSSQETGKVKFYSVGTNAISWQYINGNSFVQFPITNAELMNNTNPITHVATSASVPGTLYTNVSGKWIASTGWDIPEELVATTPRMNPEADVTYVLAEADDKLVNTSFIATISGNGFSLVDANGESVSSLSVPYDADGPLKVKVRYTPQNVHDNEVKGRVTFTHSTYSDITATSDEITARETYVPEFKVAPLSLLFPALTTINTTNTMPVGPTTFQLSTVLNNVTALVSDEDYYDDLLWDSSSSSKEFEFHFGEGKKALDNAYIAFTPTIAGNHSAEITLTVAYSDKNGAKKGNTEKVVLNVSAEATNLLQNQLDLTDESKQALLNMCLSVPVKLEFVNHANTSPIVVDFVDNGDPATLTKEDYVIKASYVPTTTPKVIISQVTDGTYLPVNLEYEVSITKCQPNVQWNWSDLYVGETFTNPYTTNGDGEVIFKLEKITKNGVSVEITEVVEYDAESKKITIKPNLVGEYEATFSFTQAETTSFATYPTSLFTSAIYTRPNELDLCVDSERIFKGVQYGASSVYFSEDNKVIFHNDAEWTMHFVGVPDMLSFIPTTNTQLTVLESANGNSWSSAFPISVNADAQYNIALQPTTRYLRFKVVQGTTLQDVCVTKLNRVKADVEILYMPIAADPVNTPTTRSVTFTYVSDKDLDVRFSTGDFSSEPVKLLETASGEYSQVTVMVKSTATTELEAKLIIQEQVHASEVAEIKLEIPIETYRFPQRLPIQLESGKDDAKRFHYVTTVHKDLEWDAANYTVNFKKQTSDVNDNPYITFAFDGAPSFISFVPLIDNTNWQVEESQNGNIWERCQNPSFVDGVFKQTLLYTSRYVRVTYVGSKLNLVKMTKVNIMSDQSAVPNPQELNLTEANTYTSDLTKGADLNVTTVNLTNMTIATDNANFTLSYDSKTPATSFVLDADKIANVFGTDIVGEIPFKVFWNATKVSDNGNIIITTKINEDVKTLATIPLIGNANSIGKDDVLYTGVPNGYTLNGSFSGIYAIEGNDGTSHRQVNLSNVYDVNGNALFDFLVVYGETTTVDGSTIITAPDGIKGSNAKTPVLIYSRNGNTYQFTMMEENANAADKIQPSLGVKKDQTLRVYITGFCPYATTGYTKEDEGVWYFQGVNGAKLDIYLDDCYIYSRNKTPEGRSFSGRYDGQAFSEPFVRGSGGVLVLENQDNDKDGAFEVTIHTINQNMFKSNYGCFFELMKGMRAFQVSSPIQVHLASENHQANSVTTITFDDKWPIDATDYNKFERTNGFLSLQKQVNNAPSIDLGNANTIINFKGGQVELQNAAVVSPNYKTTLAISFRSGLMAGFPMALGIGTDDVGGQVYFYDGTTTVIPMHVDPKFKDYYLLDTDEEGQYITSGAGDNTKYLTSCLRCPTHTRIYGGSHCMMRACEDVTSKGGAPMDENGASLGIYKYPKMKQGAARGGFSDPNAIGLVTPTDISDIGYGAESVTPSTNGTISDTSDDFLNFWFTTNEESSVKPEVDKTINFWKACMTEISAEYMSYGGTVGGDTKIFPTEDIKYLLYCQLDDNISNVITAGTGEGDDKVFSYEAPVKDPTGQLASPYLKIRPKYVGEEWQNYIETVELTEGGDISTGEDYTVTDKVYYVVPATADTWMSFTAPFNVERLWVVETYDEDVLATTPNKEVLDEDGNLTILTQRESVLLEQAKHNADFAAFFGVAMALGRDQTFEEIYNDYIGWAEYTDKVQDKRGKIQLQHYDGTNFSTANYYLYKNNGYWMNTEEGFFKPAWEVVGKVNEGDVLMQQGETYSLLFPYCTGCDVEFDENGNLIMDENGLPMLSGIRDYWDYWSGKFLIFESTLASAEHPHTIKGSKHHDALFAPAFSEDGSYAVLTGNNTFALMQTTKEFDNKVYTYVPFMNYEGFMNQGVAGKQTIQPTVSFLIADIPMLNGMPAKSIGRDGKINYGKGNTPSGTQNGNIPTINGGSDIFVTEVVNGINIAVATPQYVRVLSSSGAMLYSGMVESAVDVNLPNNGIYVVAGENTSLKIMY